MDPKTKIRFQNQLTDFRRTHAELYSTLVDSVATGRMLYPVDYQKYADYWRISLHRLHNLHYAMRTLKRYGLPIDPPCPPASSISKPSAKRPLENANLTPLPQPPKRAKEDSPNFISIFVEIQKTLQTIYSALCQLDDKTLADMNQQFDTDLMALKTMLSGSLIPQNRDKSESLNVFEAFMKIKSCVGNVRETISRLELEKVEEMSKALKVDLKMLQEVPGKPETGNIPDEPEDPVIPVRELVKEQQLAPET